MATLLPFRDINRPSGDVRLNNGPLLGSKRVSSIAGILGIIKLKLDKYIIVITKAEPAGRLRGQTLYRVVATEFLSLRERRVQDPDEDTYLAYLKAIIANGPMYFSYSFDLTNSFQRQAQADLSQPLWKRADDRFFWNRFIQTDLIDLRLGGGSSSGLRSSQQPAVDPFILPVIYGMLRVSPARIKNTSFTFALITRRSRFRGGTRFFSRGIDADGNVANYNETEQIAILNDATGQPAGFAAGQTISNGAAAGSAKDSQILSYVQTRGSVPVFWAEINNLRYTPKLQIRGVETAVDAARKHFSQQISIYGDNYLVNLVNQHGREERVKKAYEQIVRTLVSSPPGSALADGKNDALQTFDRLHYVYFDFHHETKGLRWHRAELLLNDLSAGLRKGQYFRGVEMLGDPGRLEMRTQQTAVVRTNCMDCLDRTNVVQSMLGRWALAQQFSDLGILSSGERPSDDAAFENLFRNVWADNADVVSKSYSGTGALKTDFTRTGSRTRAGMAQDLSNSITRYVRNNFLDGPRQDSFDLFLGAYLPSASGAGLSLTFADRRPLLVQAVPYVLAASVFFILFSILTKRSPDSAVWPVRIFTLLCVVVAAWAVQFIISNGILFVNWPKLNTPAFAAEGYSDALHRAHKDQIIGQFIPAPTKDRRGHAASTSNIEEGTLDFKTTFTLPPAAYPPWDKASPRFAAKCYTHLEIAHYKDNFKALADHNDDVEYWKEDTLCHMAVYLGAFPFPSMAPVILTREAMLKVITILTGRYKKILKRGDKDKTKLLFRSLAVFDRRSSIGASTSEKAKHDSKVDRKINHATIPAENLKHLVMLLLLLGGLEAQTPLAAYADSLDERKLSSLEQSASAIVVAFDPDPVTRVSLHVLTPSSSLANIFDCSARFHRIFSTASQGTSLTSFSRQVTSWSSATLFLVSGTITSLPLSSSSTPIILGAYLPTPWRDSTHSYTIPTSDSSPQTAAAALFQLSPRHSIFPANPYNRDSPQSYFNQKSGISLGCIVPAQSRTSASSIAAHMNAPVPGPVSFQIDGDFATGTFQHDPDAGSGAFNVDLALASAQIHPPHLPDSYQQHRLPRKISFDIDTLEVWGVSVPPADAGNGHGGGSDSDGRARESEVEKQQKRLKWEEEDAARRRGVNFGGDKDGARALLELAGLVGDRAGNRSGGSV
ncbi:hypothetical protein DV737_g1831, partial [Chaetothyriales sp. CBS 132003]